MSRQTEIDINKLICLYGRSFFTHPCLDQQNLWLLALASMHFYHIPRQTKANLGSFAGKMQAGSLGGGAGNQKKFSDGIGGE
ncbi:MAG: hypothetical protein HQK55_18795 [Deltaproteobacteria bacterium]|nr:hypothetical protein [Deltaproteobacteria bacterium]